MFRFILSQSYLLLSVILSIFLSKIIFAGDTITFSDPIFSGTGCPPNTVTAIKNPSNDTISVLFDNFSSSVPSNSENDNDCLSDENTKRYSKRKQGLNHKLCTMSFNMTIPAGTAIKKIQIKNDFRGFVFLEQGVRAVFRSTLLGSREGRRGGLKGRRKALIPRKSWFNKEKTPLEDDWLIRSRKFLPIRTTCKTDKKDQVFHIQIRNILMTAASKKFEHNSGELTLDTKDIKGSMSIKLYKKKCSNVTRRSRGRGRAYAR